MYIGKIVKQYEDAMTNYLVEVEKYNKAKKKHDKKAKKHSVVTSQLFHLRMYGEGIKRDFYTTAKGLEKLKMVIDKFEVKVKVPTLLADPPKKPTLEVGPNQKSSEDFMGIGEDVPF